MGTVEDVCKVLQDFLAPELRAVTAELSSLRQIMDARFDGVDFKLKALSSEIAQVKGSLSGEIAQVRESLEIDRRLAKLESKQASVSQ